MRGPPVVLTNTLGRPVTNVISERGAVPMTVVNTLGEPVTLVNSGGEPVTLFNANGTLWDYPFSLFSNNEQGAWYDPSDYSTLYQDAAGTTPVTAVEQPVRLMLDRSRGLVLGSELWGTPALSGSSWAWDGSTLTGLGVTTGTATGSAVVAGRSYRITLTVSATGSGLFQVRVGTTFIATLAGGANTTYTYIVAATSTTGLEFTSSGGTTGTITNISCRELPGNHAVAPNDASRPVLRSRYNLLTYSEQFDNAAWTKTNATVTANAAVAPDGTTTADKLIVNNGATNGRPQQAVTTANATVYTVSCYAKAAEWGFIRFRIAEDLAQSVWFDLTAGAVGTREAGWSSASIQSVGNGWYRCSATHTTVGTSVTYRFIPESADNNSATGDGTSGILIWGAQLLTAADQSATGGAYQRIAAATDYDTSNPVWRPYLAFDGSDDSLSTSSIDFSGTDEMTVFAGVTKLSDAATVCVMSYNGTSNASAEMFAPRTTGANGDFAFSHRTTTVQEAGAATVVLSPATAVLTGISDISASSVQLRRNGAVVQTVTTAIDANNYTSGTIRVGHRSSNLYLNGRLYSLAVLGRTATAAEIGAMEAWVNGKTGAY